MNDFHQKFKSSSFLKKALLYNVYAIILAVLFFGMSLIVNYLFDYFFDEITYSESINTSLHSSTFYVVAVAWGYTMAALALFTKMSTPKPKK